MYMQKKILHTVIVCIIAWHIFLSASTLVAQEVLDNLQKGTAVRGSASDFPQGGFVALSNSLPQGSRVSVVDSYSKKSVEVKIIGSINEPGLLLILSPQASEQLGILSGNVLPVSVDARVIQLPLEENRAVTSIYESDRVRNVSTLDEKTIDETILDNTSQVIQNEQQINVPLINAEDSIEADTEFVVDMKTISKNSDNNVISPPLIADRENRIGSDASTTLPRGSGSSVIPPTISGRSSEAGGSDASMVLPRDSGSSVIPPTISGYSSEAGGSDASTTLPRGAGTRVIPPTISGRSSEAGGSDASTTLPRGAGTRVEPPTIAQSTLGAGTDASTTLPRGSVTRVIPPTIAQSTLGAGTDASTTLPRGAGTRVEPPTISGRSSEAGGSDASTTLPRGSVTRVEPPTIAQSTLGAGTDASTTLPRGSGTRVEPPTIAQSTLGAGTDASTTLPRGAGTRVEPPTIAQSTVNIDESDTVDTKKQKILQKDSEQDKENNVESTVDESVDKTMLQELGLVSAHMKIPPKDQIDESIAQKEFENFIQLNKQYSQSIQFIKRESIDIHAYYVQIAAFFQYASIMQNKDLFNNSIYQLQVLPSKDYKIFRAISGPFYSQKDAIQVRNYFQKNGIIDAYVRMGANLQ